MSPSERSVAHNAWVQTFNSHDPSEFSFYFVVTVEVRGSDGIVMDSLERLLRVPPGPSLASITASAIGRKGRHLTGTFCLTGDTMEGIIQCLVFLKAFSRLRQTVLKSYEYIELISGTRTTLADVVTATSSTTRYNKLWSLFGYV
ncbi:hypothetical protein J6590_053361 [Homalodisca vitripennis]|nr:hypothetical protein J6590_053361 [Homalodisca vitripennis]